MKTALQIKDEIVQEGGYKSYEDFEDQLTFGREKEIYIAIHLIDEVAKRLAKQVAQKALEDAAEQAVLSITFSHPNVENKKSSHWRDVMGELYEIDKQSILTTPIIIE